MSINHTIMTKFSDKDIINPSSDGNSTVSYSDFCLKNARTVNVLSNGKNRDDISLLNALLSVLSSRGLHVRVMCDSRPVSQVEMHDSMSLSFFSRNDFSIFGSPKSSILKEFIDTPSDIFIDLTSSDKPRIRKIRRQLKHKLSIGVNPHIGIVYDFVFSIPSGSDYNRAFESMMNYLDIINR